MPTLEGDYSKRDLDSKHNERISDLMSVSSGGTLNIRSKGDLYLQQFSRETQTSFQKRINKSILDPATKDAINSTVGKIFSKPIIVENYPTSFNTLNIMNSFDNNGTDFQDFAEELARNAIKDGLCFAYVAFPKVAGGNKSQNDVISENLRPYARIVTSKAVINKVYSNVHGRDVLSQVTILEYHHAKSNNGFNTVVSPAYRVIELRNNVIYYNLYVGGDSVDNGVINPIGSDNKSIPLIPCYAEKERFFVGKAPFEDLAVLNIEHYNLTSDFRNQLHVKGGATPVLTGSTTTESKGESIVISGDTILQLEEGSKFEFVTGGGELSYSVDEIIRIEKKMDSMKLDITNDNKQTATESLINKAQVESKLLSIVSNVEQSLNSIMKVMCIFSNETWQGEIKLSKDFDLTVMSAEDANLLDNRYAMGLIDRITWLKENHAGERLRTVSNVEELGSVVDGLNSKE